jgi:transposase-like protein
MKEDIRMRQKWLELYVETGSVTKTALRCGITRSTLYRWINCEKEQGKSELSDKSKRSSRLANMKITPENHLLQGRAADIRNVAQLPPLHRPDGNCHSPPKTVQTKRLKQLIVSWCCLFNG